MTDNKTASSLNELIEIARDGDTFYTEAAEKVRDKNLELSSLFTRIAGVKRRIVTELGATVAATGEKPAEHGTVQGSLQKTYAKVRTLFGDTEYAYVSELEEAEDRLLEAFRDTLKDTGTPPAARVAADALMPEVIETHNIMRSRKFAMKKAS